MVSGQELHGPWAWGAPAPHLIEGQQGAQLGHWLGKLPTSLRLGFLMSRQGPRQAHRSGLRVHSGALRLGHREGLRVLWPRP